MGTTQRLHIERLSNSPDGIAHLEDGKTVFVAGVCPGDVVDARVIEDHPRYARAEVISLVTPSPDRVDARCPYAGRCGGCAWQHISYDAQLGAKRGQVVDALVRIGGLDADEIQRSCTDCLPSPAQWGYRNKVEFEFGPGKKPSLGLHAGGGDLLQIDECLLLPKCHAKIPKALRGALRYLQGSSGRRLEISRVGVRSSQRTDELEFAFWAPPGTLPRKPLATVVQGIHGPTSVVGVLCRKGDKARKVAGVEVYSGAGCWHERLEDDVFAFSAPSFFQVNTAAAELLRRTALAPLEGLQPKRAFDLYSGAGTFTAPLARLAGEVCAIESAGSSVRDLERNLRHCATPARIIGGDVARELPALGPADVCLVDPPRAGLATNVVDSLCEARPERLVYVSCNPATLARDLKLLTRECFRIESVTPVDLFPQTPHVECCVHLVLQ